MSDDPPPGARDAAPYDARRLSYAATFPDARRAAFIRAIETVTGRAGLLRLVRRFEAMGVPRGQAFWGQALDVLGIEIRADPSQIARIPRDGPLVVCANHPHGLVDGLVLADLVGRRRGDYRILTRSLLTGVAEVEQFLIPVPFAHDPDAHERSIEMRRRAMAQLGAGGAVVLFPAGVVAVSDSLWGPAVEAEWSRFTARLIQRSGAAVVPVFFPGSNSRAYQIANRLSPVLRQGLLLREILHARNRPQAPLIGAPLDRALVAGFVADSRGFMAWLREHTLSLGDGGTG